MKPTLVDAGAQRPGLLVVLPHFRNEQESARALQSLREAEYPGLHVLVIDNGGALASRPEWVRGPEQREDFVQPEENLGWCAAMNLGLRRAQELGLRYLLQLNADCEIESGALEALVDALEADAGVAGAMPLLHDGTRIWSAGSDLRFGPNQVKHRCHGLPLSEAPERPMLVDFVPGACALLRCSAIESIGGFDERYFMYLEDAELGLRLQRSGFRLVALPWARARHSGSSASGGGASPLRKFLMAANTPRFLRTARSPRLWLSFVCFDVLAWPLVAGVSLLRGRGLASPLAKARGIVWGLRGHRPGPADVQHYLGSRS